MRVCAFLIFCVHPKKTKKNEKKQQSPARILRPNKLCYFCASFFFWTWDVAFGVNELFKVKLERIVKVKIKRTSAEATCKKIREQELLFHCACVCVCVCLLRCVCSGVCVCAGERVIGIESTRTVPTRMCAISNAQLEIISSNRNLYIKSRYNYGYLMIENCLGCHVTFKFLYTCNTWRMINLRKTTLRMIPFSVR